MGRLDREASDLPDLIEVRCVDRVKHDDPCSRILGIGGLRDGVTWKMTQSDAIEAMERGDMRFGARLGNHLVVLVVAVDKSGRRYLKCSTDGIDPLALLSLPQCPPSLPLRTHFDWADVEAKDGGGADVGSNR